MAHQENQAQRATWRWWKEPRAEVLPKGPWMVAPVPSGEGPGAHSHSLRRGSPAALPALSYCLNPEGALGPARTRALTSCSGGSSFLPWADEGGLVCRGTSRSPPPARFCSIQCCCLVAQSCQTLCDHMDYSLPGSSLHGILQARILEWVAISCSRGSS